jgi:gentisate 1,2-dioxygenase
MTMTQQPTDDRELARLYQDFDADHLTPLWTQLDELMPMTPAPRAVPFVWKWSTLYPLAQRAGNLVPVGRGGERRAIALANPGLGGAPFVTPTLWAAIQYLGPRETAPEHRHSQNAFRFVVEGEGVWTVVNGDPVAMRRGDFLLTPGWHFHGHHNETDQPMAWIDGLDIPFQYDVESQFFDFGREHLSEEEHATPDRSRSERLWGHPGLVPVSQFKPTEGSPLLCYRWADTDAALTDQLQLDREGYPSTVERGHAVVRYTNPTTAGDVLPTIRVQFHRIESGVETAPRRETGSSVYQVFDGSGRVTVGDFSWSVQRGDLFVVPSWMPLSVSSQASGSDSDSGALDLFQFSDAPIFSKLNLFRSHVEEVGR